MPKNLYWKMLIYQVLDLVKPYFMKKKILVLCTGNSCRSQIAHGYLNFFGGDLVEVFSAGVETRGVHPRAIKTMLEFCREFIKAHI